MLNTKKEKILILTGNYGDGHIQVAKALHDALTIQYPDLEPVIYNVTEWVHPYINQISRYIYIQGLKTFPQVYGFIFQKTRNINSFSNMVKSFFSIGVGRMLKLIEDVQPTVVVSTFPLAAAVMSRLKAYSLINIPTVTTITDHTNHSSWIYPHTDQYIVGSSLVRDALIDLGVDKDRIAATGIPVRPQFSKSYNREEVMKNHGLNPHVSTVLIMGGGCGLIGEETMKTLEAIHQPIQLIIVCGHNKKLRLQLADKVKGSKHLVRLLGYVDCVHELMAVSDVMITKPGGVTTFEAIAMGLPMLLYRPIPGQEQDNAKFLIQSGVALLADTSEDLFQRLSDILSNPKLLKQMRKNTEKLHPKEAAITSLNFIIGLKMASRANPESSYPIGAMLTVLKGTQYKYSE